jgi:hypothetical protein
MNWPAIEKRAHEDRDNEERASRNLPPMFRKATRSEVDGWYKHRNACMGYDETPVNRHEWVGWLSREIAGYE